MLTPEREKKIRQETDFSVWFKEIVDELLSEIDRLRADAKDDKEFHEKFTFQQANEYLKVRENLAVAVESVTQACKDCVEIWQGDSAQNIVIQAADYILSQFKALSKIRGEK
jgi:hypothetical protein